MSRILLVALLAVACKGGSRSARDSSAARDSRPASGAVMAAPPSEATTVASLGKVIEVEGKVTVRGKPLAVGDVLTADDVIETDSHGRVVVLLAIDDSHWELGPNQRAKVSEASVWTVLADAGSRTQDAGASSDAAATPSKQAAAPKPPPPHEASDSGSTGGATVGQAKISSDAAADLIGRQESALRRCLSVGARVQIHVQVNDAGKVSTSIDGASSPAVSTCLKGVIARVKLAAAAASVNMTIENGSQ